MEASPCAPAKRHLHAPLEDALANDVRCTSAITNGVPRARPQVRNNNAITNLEVPQLTTTSYFFYVRAGQTPRPDLHAPLGATLANAVRSWYGNSAMPCYRLY